MTLFKKRYAGWVIVLGLMSGNAFSSENRHAEPAAASSVICTGFGPQTPRDIDSVKGENTRAFSLAPNYKQMNLCNIHFHENAEHKAKAFSIFAGAGHEGYDSGYKCNMSKSLSKA